MGLFGKIQRGLDAAQRKVDDAQRRVDDMKGLASQAVDSNSVTRAVAGKAREARPTLAEGPHEVSVYAPDWKLAGNLKPGRSARMAVMPGKVTVRTANAARETRDGEVCLAYKGVPCCFMGDGLGTLMDEARRGAVEVEVHCERDYLGKPALHAKWYSYDPAERERELAERFADEDARSVWFNLRADKWDGRDAERLDFDGASLSVAEPEGKAKPVITIGVGGSEITVTGKTKAHGDLLAHADGRVEHVMMLKRGGDYGDYYRVKVLFAE